MSRRILLLGIGAALLVALNIWKWWPDVTQYRVTSDVKSENFSADQLIIVGDFEGNLGVNLNERDIFKPKPKIRSEVVKKQPPPIQTVQKTAEELEHEAAEQELTQYNCIGIAVHNGITQAFIINNGQNVLVSRGDRVSARFIVDKIDPEGIVLTDSNTGVSGTIRLSVK